MKTNALVRQLAWAIVVKLCLLTALWWGWVREQRVEVKPETVLKHWTLGVPVPEVGGNHDQ